MVAASRRITLPVVPAKADAPLCPGPVPMDQDGGFGGMDEHGCPMLVGGGVHCCLCSGAGADSGSATDSPNKDWKKTVRKPCHAAVRSCWQLLRWAKISVLELIGQ